MGKTNFMQVDETSFIKCSDLDDLARRIGILIEVDRSDKFVEALQMLRKDLLIVSKMIMEDRK